MLRQPSKNTGQMNCKTQSSQIFVLNEFNHFNREIKNNFVYYIRKSEDTKKGKKTRQKTLYTQSKTD